MNAGTPLFGPKRHAGSRAAALALAWAMALGLAACGGGGSASGAATATATAVTTTTTTAVVAVTTTTGGTAPALGDANVAAVYMDGGPATLASNVPNALFVDIRVCAPGSSSNCAVVDHVLVDTGSIGLRLVAQSLPASLLAALPQSTATGGSLAGECLAFASGVTWGGVRLADLRVGGSSQSGELAASLPIQTIGDTDARLATVPSACTAQGALMQTVAALGANGILGIGLFAQDCGSACASSALSVYFSCPGAGRCTRSAMALASQVAHPVGLFSGDNNGSSLVLPALPGRSAASASGLLVFGIGTRANNALAAGSSVIATGDTGYFTAAWNGSSLPNSFIDSGSTVNFFPTTGSNPVPVCSGSLSAFFCPASDLTLTASLSGASGTTASAQVLTVNARTAFASAPSANAFVGLAGTSSSIAGSLDLGASFFFGRSVTTLTEKRTANGVSVTGPAVAFTP